ncbi:glucoamylase family protein [Aquiflexum gelatinilyticum]|uniref:Ig-like domain-containing protein n=1 Tax=Aquiflexum gelatinilyticum TaxID=2961943 RepID=A0A9X2SZ82_9BACT|nr:glucoamylase family protein [Aquiflexum gelatinilyticum]MCR9014133.1 Ig-like domain-containing protein [Aquiflexum gelatinilyticum]
MKKLLFLFYVLLIFSCDEKETDATALTLDKVEIGDIQINLTGTISENLPFDRPITLGFSLPIDPSTAANSIFLLENNQAVDISISFNSGNKNVVIFPVGILKTNTEYTISISGGIKGTNNSTFAGKEIKFKTNAGDLQILSLVFENSEQTKTGKTVNVPLNFSLNIDFSGPVHQQSLISATKITGASVPNLQFAFSDNDKKVTITSSALLNDLTKFTFEISNALKGAEGQGFAGVKKEFFTSHRPDNAFPVISEEELLTKVQEQTFRYFWDFAHPNSGMARERNTSGNLVTSGGTGFGLMAILVGIERGFITRQQGIERIVKITDFLGQADRFHGAWAHWMDGNTGKVIPFSAKDNGGDLVETGLLVQGLLTVKAYLNPGIHSENSLTEKIDVLWRGVEWDWYTRGGQDILYWHWSPEFGWDMNLPIRGYNESLIVYVLGAASPTHPIDLSVYEKGWANNGAMRNGKMFYQIPLPLGYDFGGPLFFAHYSFLGLDPRNLSDQYANYWIQNVNHSRINQAHAISNPLGFAGYSESSWGLTASDNHLGYNAHSPTNDLGVISPTAALSSFPYTPTESMKALQFFYYKMGEKLWGQYGFYDAFNISEQWYADSYLAIDQGPIIIMIENHRSGLLWDLFMKDQEVRAGLDKLGFKY